MGFLGTLGRIGAGVGTGGLSEVAIRGVGALRGGKPPPSPDYQGIAQQQQQYNRPNQSTPNASLTWDKDLSGIGDPPQFKGNMQQYIAAMRAYEQAKANAPMKQTTALADPLQQANTNLMGQAQQNLSTPMDWNQFGALGTGDQARQQAIDAAYGQATSRLDPQWKQREEASRTQLLNQGLDPSSEAFKNQLRDMNFARNDAYGSAMNSAILQGNQAGNDVFRNDMMRRQQMIAEELKRRGQPVEEMRGFLPFLQMPGVPQDNSMMQGAKMQGDWDMNAWLAKQQRDAELIGGGVDIVKTFGPAMMKGG